MAKDPTKNFRRSYTFGGDTGLTQEEINARRRILNALSTSQKNAPKNVGEGIHAIGKALAARMMMQRLRKDQLDFNRMGEAWFDADLEEYKKSNPAVGVVGPGGPGGGYETFGDILGRGPGGGTYKTAPGPGGLPLIFGR